MHIRRMTLADTADIGDFCARSFDNDEIFVKLHPRRHQYPSDFRRYFLRKAQQRYYRGFTMLVMVTDEHDYDWSGRERVMGHLAMSKDPPPIRDWQDVAWGKLNLNLLWLEEKYIELFGLDWSADAYAVAQFRAADASSSILDDISPSWYLDVLVTDTRFQKRGVGARLVQAAQLIAAQDALPLTLASSRVAASLYLRCGFKIIGRNNTSDLMVWQ